MSQYTAKMETQLRTVGAFDYDSAAAFADEHSLSVRSVISKVKSLGLEYTPREKVVAATPRIRKADVVASIAAASGADLDAIAGLAKADLRSLQELLKAL
jgi:hypothetical protein